jgi:hypothetical protein
MSNYQASALPNLDDQQSGSVRSITYFHYLPEELNLIIGEYLDNYDIDILPKDLIFNQQEYLVSKKYGKSIISYLKLHKYNRKYWEMFINIKSNISEMLVKFLEPINYITIKDLETEYIPYGITKYPYIIKTILTFKLLGNFIDASLANKILSHTVLYSNSIDREYIHILDIYDVNKAIKCLIEYYTTNETFFTYVIVKHSIKLSDLFKTNLFVDGYNTMNIVIHLSNNYISYMYKNFIVIEEDTTYPEIIYKNLHPILPNTLDLFKLIYDIQRSNIRYIFGKNLKRDLEFVWYISKLIDWDKIMTYTTSPLNIISAWNIPLDLYNTIRSNLYSPTSEVDYEYIRFKILNDTIYFLRQDPEIYESILHGDGDDLARYKYKFGNRPELEVRLIFLTESIITHNKLELVKDYPLININFLKYLKNNDMKESTILEDITSGKYFEMALEFNDLSLIYWMQLNSYKFNYNSDLGLDILLKYINKSYDLISQLYLDQNYMDILGIIKKPKEIKIDYLQPEDLFDEYGNDEIEYDYEANDIEYTEDTDET